jgi:secondary thiamine-phosphate synthase enzyme
MKIVNERIRRHTKESGDLLDITPEVAALVRKSGVKTGNVLIFVIGSTAGITTLEYEPGLIADMKEFYQQMAPSGRHYHHDETWGDANGYSHIGAPSPAVITVPIENGAVILGTWQQVVLAEFDNRPRDRRWSCR